MLKIDKIWMEIELWFPWWNCRDHSTFCWITYANKWWMNITNKFWFKTSISKEYYKNQVEFNIPWTKNKWIDMRHKVACLCDKFPEEAFTVSLKWPAFVGTHIHYSFLNDKWEPVDYPIKNKVLILMLNIISFYIEYFKTKIKKTKECDQFLVYPTLKNEMERLVKNHNILINRDTKVFDRRIENFLNRKNNWFIYTNGRDNIRYRPIIWSPARPWKPFTMEIRYISNLIWLDQKEITKFNKMVETIMNSHNWYKTKADLEKLKNLIFDKYKELYSLYESLNKWKVADSSWNLMTINMYQKWIVWKKLCIDIPKYNIYLSKCSQNDNNLKYSFAKWSNRFLMNWLRDMLLSWNIEKIKDIYEILNTYCKKQKIKDWPMTIVSEWSIVWSEEDISNEKDILKILLKNTYKILDKTTDTHSINVLVHNVITWEQWTIRYGKKVPKSSIDSIVSRPCRSVASSLLADTPQWPYESRYAPRGIGSATLMTQQAENEIWGGYSNLIRYCGASYLIFISDNERVSLVHAYTENWWSQLENDSIELISNIPDCRRIFGNFHPNIEQAVNEVWQLLANEIKKYVQRTSPSTVTSWPTSIDEVMDEYHISLEESN